MKLMLEGNNERKGTAPTKQRKKGMGCWFMFHNQNDSSQRQKKEEIVDHFYEYYQVNKRILWCLIQNRTQCVSGKWIARYFIMNIKIKVYIWKSTSSSTSGCPSNRNSTGKMYDSSSCNNHKKGRLDT